MCVGGNEIRAASDSIGQYSGNGSQDLHFASLLDGDRDEFPCTCLSVGLQALLFSIE
jgi:hypothetical protein